MQVFIENCGVQLVALEAAAHEEGTAASQNAAEHRHVEVDAGGNVGRCHAVAKQQVGQQQVVDMAAMAGHVDDFVAAGDVLNGLEVVDADAVIQLVPEPAQDHFQKADDGIGEVGGHLVGVARCDGLGLALADAFFAGFTGNGGAHQRRVQQALEQGTAVYQFRANHGGALLAEVHAQHAVDAAHAAFRVHLRGDQLRQCQARAKVHADFATVQHDGQQLAQPSANPVPGKQQLDGGGLAVRRLAPEHGDRNQLHTLRVLQHLAQPRRLAARVGPAHP